MSDEQFKEYPLNKPLPGVNVIEYKAGEEKWAKQVAELSGVVSDLKRQREGLVADLEKKEEEYKSLQRTASNHKTEMEKYKLKWEIERDRFDELMTKIVDKI